MPGGKPNGEESPIETLVREIEVEELPGTVIDRSSIKYYGAFSVTSPNKKEPIYVKVYLASAQRIGEPAREILAKEWIRSSKTCPLSQVTSDIVIRLQTDGHIYFP